MSKLHMTDTASHPAADLVGEAATSAMREKLRRAEGFDAQQQLLAPDGDGDSTSGGVWSTDTYTPVIEGQLRGAAIDIRFDPNATVDATEIGLLQTVKSTRTKAGEGAAAPEYGGDDVREARSLADGTNIDRAAGENSPYFAEHGKAWMAGGSKAVTRAFKGTDGTKDRHDAAMKKATSEVTLSHFGHRTPGAEPKAATLHDRAKLTWRAGDELTCLFETTAQATAGEQAGTFYGSVEWGYKVDAKGEVTLIEFRVLHQGTPSETFAAAAKKWNEAEAYQLVRYYDEQAVRQGGAPNLMAGSGAKAYLDKTGKPASAIKGLKFAVPGNEKIPSGK